MAFVRGRPWDQHDAARRTEQHLLRHPTQDARVLDVARYHQALALFIQGDVQLLHRCWSWLEDAEDRHDLFLGSWLKVLLASQRVARGHTDTAREMCRRAARMWAEQESMEKSSLGLTHRDVLGACDAYDGDEAAFDRLREATGWLDRSPLVRVPSVGAHCHGMWARAALACAQQERRGSGRREELLNEAEAYISITARPLGLSGRAVVLPHYRNLATLMSASLAALRGDTESALSRLDRGLEQMRAAGSYSLRSAHARRARGILLGGDEGDALIAQAVAELESLGVKDPARHARSVIPGFSK